MYIRVRMHLLHFWKIGSFCRQHLVALIFFNHIEFRTMWLWYFVRFKNLCGRKGRYPSKIHYSWCIIHLHFASQVNDVILWLCLRKPSFTVWSVSSNIVQEITFVAFCSFFPYSLTVVHRGRQQKSGGRQQKSSRADKQHCFP